MQRTFACKALVINVKPVGENNSNITLLTEEKGILRAVLYGGPKSKMKSLLLCGISGTSGFTKILKEIRLKLLILK